MFISSMKKICALFLLFFLQTDFLESCFSRKERLGLVEKKDAQEQKIIDPLDHMAAIAGLFSLSAGLDAHGKAALTSTLSFLLSRLVSQKEDNYHVDVRVPVTYNFTDGSCFRSDSINICIAPKLFERKYLDVIWQKIDDFQIAPIAIFDSYEKSDNSPDMIEVCSREYDYANSRWGIKPKLALKGFFDPTKISITAIPKTRPQFTYRMKNGIFSFSMPFDKLLYSNHYIVATSVEGFAKHQKRVSLYAIPQDPGYKDKDV